MTRQFDKGLGKAPKANKQVHNQVNNSIRKPVKQILVESIKSTPRKMKDAIVSSLNKSIKALLDLTKPVVFVYLALSPIFLLSAIGRYLNADMGQAITALLGIFSFPVFLLVIFAAMFIRYKNNKNISQ